MTRMLYSRFGDESFILCVFFDVIYSMSNCIYDLLIIQT